MGGDRTSYLTRSTRERAFRYPGGPSSGYFALSEFAYLQMKFFGDILWASCFYSSLSFAALAAPATAAAIPSPPYLSPAESLKLFHLPSGYRLELVLSEPKIREPIVSAFDGNGPVLEISFPPTNAQWIRLTQTGTAKVMWVVDGVQFYSPPIPPP